MNVAVIVLSASRLRLQVSVPLQLLPLHPLNTELLSALAESVMLVPPAVVSVQVPPQEIIPPETIPPPVPDLMTVRVYCCEAGEVPPPDESRLKTSWEDNALLYTDRKSTR